MHLGYQIYLFITLTTTINQTTTKTLTLTRNLTFSLKWPCHVTSRDQSSFLPITGQGSILTLRNQRSKIRRSNIISTAGCPFRKISKFECRVIKHARDSPLGLSKLL